MRIINSELNIRCYDEILKIIFDSVLLKNKTTFTYINSYVCLYANKKKEFQKILNEITYRYPDGIGIYWASRFLYKTAGIKEYMTGTDLYFRIFNEFNKKGGKFFIYGGDKNSKPLLLKKIQKEFPNLSLGGYFDRDTVFNEDILNQMNNSGSDILFIGLGTPFQEEFLYKFCNNINIPVIICVGSGIDFLAGYLKRAPVFLRNLRLEWLYRFINEPRRLFKRYFFGIPLFIFKVIVQKFKLL